MTADQLVTLIVAHMIRHPTGGVAHIVLDDHNVDDRSLGWVRLHAQQGIDHEDGCALHPDVCRDIVVAIIDALASEPDDRRRFLVQAPDLFPYRWDQDAISTNRAAELAGRLHYGSNVGPGDGG